MASNERVRKVSEQIRRELVTILPEAIFHSKINFVSVTGMELSRDFKFATMFVTIIGDDELRDELVELLNKRKGEIRHLLAQRMTTRTVPHMTFKYDESVEYGARMEKLLHDIVEEDEKRHGDTSPNQD
ncbi:MAG: 30S ribosome-binding factor RbfA [Gammaproteobacteria bacterium]|nr:30S ribosome-binding factor RbfA [Gammaproteobacteria bacterium]